MSKSDGFTRSEPLSRLASLFSGNSRALSRHERIVDSHLSLRSPDWWVILRNYRQQHGRYPRLLRPRSFNDKVTHRMLFDRRPILQEMTDKLAVRNYVRSRLGSAILPKQYLVTTQPAAIPFNDLPDKFVVKPTHGSGWVRIVRDRSTIDRAALIATCGEWLSQSFYERTREWSYKQIVPRISIEELIENEADASPHEYKLFVFGGRVRMIQVATGRFKALRRRLYTPSWEGIDALLDRGDVPGDDMKRPPHLKDMISAAEALAEDIDFVRADFYDTPDKLYFGELTTTPACGYYRPVPLKLDYVLGDFWKLRGP